MSESLPPAFDPWFEARCPDIRLAGARAVLELAEGGATVPFITRYRKERTCGLDEVAVRRALEAGELFLKIVSRQRIIVESIERHATLTPELRERILSTLDLDSLEDLYHPYRQQKKNRALAAREAGLEPLADWIWNCGHGVETPQEGQTLELWAFTFRNEEKSFPDAKSAIEGARDILVERLAGTPELRALVRRAYFDHGWLRATKAEKAKPHSKFETYFAFQEKVSSLREPASSHRYLAVRRGQAEDELQVSVGGPPDDAEFEARLVAAFEAAACTVPESPGAEVLRHAGRIAFKNNVRTSIENEVHRELKEAADVAAAHVFAENVRRRLLDAPLGPKPVLGIDPGIRTGCKLAAVDAAGTLVATEVIHLQTDEQKLAARETVVRLAREHPPAAVAVGNGTGGREAEVFVRSALREGRPRGAGRAGERGGGERLQHERRGARGVPRPRRHGAGGDLDRPAAPGPPRRARQDRAAQHRGGAVPARRGPRRAAAGARRGRRGLRQRRRGRPEHRLATPPRPRGGHRARPRRRDRRAPREGGALPLASAAPRRAPIRTEGVRAGGRLPAGARGRAARSTTPRCTPSATPRSRLWRPASARGSRTCSGPEPRSCARPQSLKEELGALTWEDVITELEKPGRDPRAAFVPFSFREDVQKLEDLKPGMACPGIVSNVTNFGAFVDIGVHHDGLVHVSQLGARFVKDPKAALKPGDHVEVRVLKVDLEKKQISLTMRPTVEREAAREAEAGGSAREKAGPSRVARGEAGGRGAAGAPGETPPSGPAGERPRPAAPASAGRPPRAARPERRGRARRPSGSRRPKRAPSRAGRSSTTRSRSWPASRSPRSKS